MKKNKKKIPHFSSERVEKKFWEKHDSTEYIDWSKAKNKVFPNLRPSTKVISLRLSESLFDAIRMLAHKSDIPYQSLMKVFLAEKVKEELSGSKPKMNMKARPVAIKHKLPKEDKSDCSTSK